MNYITIETLIGLGFVVFMAFALFLQGYKPEACIVTLLVAGPIFCSLLGLIIYWLSSDKKTNKAIKTTINSNYDNVVNFHNCNTNKSFVSDDLKYTFNYDEETKTLVVFTGTNSSVDAVFINGIKQNNSLKTENTSDNTDKVDTDNYF